MLKAAIFDMDGTMVDTETMHSESFAQLLHSRGITPKPNKNGLIHLIGLNTEGILQFLMKHYGFNDNIEIMTTQVRNIYFDLIQNGKIKPMKGLITLLTKLKKENLKLAVASGSSSRNIYAMLTALRLQDFFAVVVGADEVQHGKPHPETYETTVTKLEVEKNECVVIEDTETGIQSAKSAGLKVIAIPNIFTKDQNFTKADTIVKSLNDITLPLLQNL